MSSSLMETSSSIFILSIASDNGSFSLSCEPCLEGRPEIRSGEGVRDVVVNCAGERGPSGWGGMRSVGVFVCDP